MNRTTTYVGPISLIHMRFQQIHLCVCVYDILLVRHWNYNSILYHFSTVSEMTYFEWDVKLYYTYPEAVCDS